MAFALVTGCTPEAEKQTDELAAMPTHVTACYRYQQGNDTISLRLVQTDKQVSGELLYNLYQKDKSNGTLSGQLSGDTLFATYTFQSEGLTSVREVAFLKQDTALVEGYGEVTETGGEMQLADKSQLEFGNTRLEILPCDALNL